MGMLFPVKYDAAIASDAGRILSPAIVVTQPEPWEALRARFGGTPAALVVADSLERAHLEKVAKELPGDVACVIGIGGGTAMDTAKWLHWRRKLKLFQIPSPQGTEFLMASGT
jgi:glycerol dehydrogenase-like iron-containing ADH family enzyme